MKRVSINLSPRPFRNENLHRLLYASCVGVLVLASLGNVYLLARHGWALSRVGRELETQRQALQELETREQELGRKLAAVDSAGLQKRAEFANTAILRRVFSWTLLFNELEKTVPPEVRLRSVRPLVDARGKVDVHMDGTAKAYADFVALEESLMKSASFSRVYPGSERVESAAYRAGAPPLPGPAAYAGATAAGEIAFSLSLEYFPGGRPKDEDAGGAGK